MHNWMLFLGVSGFRPPMDTTLRSMRRLGVDIELLFELVKLAGKLQMLRVVADRCALPWLLTMNTPTSINNRDNCSVQDKDNKNRDASRFL